MKGSWNDAGRIRAWNDVMTFACKQVKDQLKSFPNSRKESTPGLELDALIIELYETKLFKAQSEAITWMKKPRRFLLYTFFVRTNYKKKKTSVLCLYYFDKVGGMFYY